MAPTWMSSSACARMASSIAATSWPFAVPREAASPRKPCMLERPSATTPGHERSSARTCT